MKKTYLLTTLIALGATAAHADVSLSGDGRMGILSTDGGSGFVFDSRARLRFSLSSESDSGVKFGAQFRANDATKAAEGTRSTVFIEVPDYGRLTMGDADGAVTAAVVQIPIVGYTDNANKLQEFKFLTSSDGIDVLYGYTKGSLGVFASMGDPGAATGSGTTQNRDDRAVGVSYTTEFWKAAAGFEDNGVRRQTVISGSFGNGQAEVKAIYGRQDDDADQYVVYGTYIIGTTTLSAFYRQDRSDITYQGLGVSHDLGGGMSIAGSYAQKENTDAVVTFGASMSF